MNILFTCVGRRGYLLRYFRENMQPSDRIVATDMAPSAVALQLADCSLTVPSVYDDSYIDHLLSICREHSISAIFSLNDLELPILAAAKQRFVQLGVVSTNIVRPFGWNSRDLCHLVPLCLSQPPKQPWLPG